MIQISSEYFLDFTIPKVMGVVNITPDSFYEKSRVQTEEAIKKKVGQMLEEGADMLDIGAMSSRPGANQYEGQEEIDRLSNYVALTRKLAGRVPISVDTYRKKVAQYALREGAQIVNDIAAGEDDPEMLPWIAKEKIPYIMMHKRGTPAVMQQNTAYDDILTEILSFFQTKLSYFHQQQHHDIIIDPGFGFSKLLEQNYYLLRHLNYFSNLKQPILVGISRKSMIYKLLDVQPSLALNGTTVAHTLALQNGANILRTHDVKEAKEAIKIYQYYRISE